MRSRLEPEQVKILSTLVEALRSVPRSQRGRFLFSSEHGHLDVRVWNEGLNAWHTRVLPADLDVLAREGLLRFAEQHIFYVTPSGFEFYEEAKLSSGNAVERVQAEVRTYCETEQFRAAHPAAYEKWRSAEAHLWRDDHERELTTIGHLCREALQEFAEALVRQLRITDPDADKAKTINRIKLCLEHASVSRTDRAVLDALLTYWRAVNDLTQRQEHGAQRDGEELRWDHARRTVFQTLVVMYEIDRALRHEPLPARI